MRVLLIKPPIRAFMHEIGRHVPIGLAYLSSVLRAAGHEARIFDALAYTEDNAVVPPEHWTASERLKVARHPRWRHLVRWGASPQRVAAVLREARPDVVGIACMFSPYYETAYAVARLAREVAPQAHVLIGGQHPTVAPAHALAVPEIDLAVLGEAEATLPRVLDALRRGERLDTLEGVAYRCAEGRCGCARPDPARHHVQPRHGWIDDLDALPFPATDQLEFERYDRTTTLITSRGCPFACSFCTVHATVGKSFRARSPHNVVDEIAWYVERFQVRTFLIEDDNFTFDVERVQRICAEIVRRGLRVELRLPNGITAIKVTPELVASMASAGFRKLFLGLESTDAERLRAIAKTFTSLAKVQAGAARFRAAGLDVSASLIVGLPGQGAAEIARDVANLLASGLPFWSNPFYPIPGSPDFARCLEAGTIDPQTDLALYDQYNFAVGSTCFSPADLYWIWVAVQAAAQWPDYVRGAGRSPSGGWGAVEVALRELMACAAAPGAAALELPARPLGLRVLPGEALAVWLDPADCFCTQHRLVPDRAGGPAVGLCTLGGDALAAAVGLRTDCALAAEESVCRVDGAEHCTFILRPSTERPVEAAFRAALRQACRTPSAVPV